MSARFFVWFHISLMVAAVGSTIVVAFAGDSPTLVSASALPTPQPTVAVFLRRSPDEILIWEERLAARPGDGVKISVADPEKRHATVLVPDAHGFPEVLAYAPLETTHAVMLPIEWRVPESGAPPPITVALSPRELTLPQLQRLARGEDAAKVWTRTLTLRLE